jgi:hypothetical protein
MPLRKHIRQESYLSWTEHFSLFEPLSAAEKAGYEANPQQFQREFPEIRLFPDPFLNTAARAVSDAFLRDTIIVAGDDAVNQKIAAELRDRIAAEYNIQLEIISGTAELDLRARKEPLILVGGAQQNRRVQKLGQTLQLGVFNYDFPGASGWGVTTYQGVQEGTGTRFVLAGDAQSGGAAIDYFLKNALVPGAEPRLQWAHHVQVGPDLPAEFHDFDCWLRNYPSTPLEALNEWLHSDHKRPYRELFEAVLSPIRQGPLISNYALLDVGLSAIRYYQLAGDEKALHLFREMLWGFWEYFRSDDPNIYISDMDFRLGQICAYWSWVEFHPAIMEEERRVFPQLLLAAVRMVHAYYLEKWSTRAMPPGVRHNHQTFKARCLLYGWRYFQQFYEPDAEAWKRDADILFAGMDATRTKYAENATTYEPLAPEHLLAWYEITNREIGADFQHALAVFARRVWALTDNFFYRVAYGDCEISFQKRKPFQAAAWLDQTNPAFADVVELEQSTADIFPVEIPAAIHGFGSFQAKPTATGFHHLLTGWTQIPLESKLQQQCSLQGSPEQWFDKLSWRSGWRDASSYLAIEGFGNQTVSHAHNATNSVIQANWGGRVWLVGNGSGRRIGVTDAGKAFSTREIGPVDHNMLILRDADGSPITPPVNALLIDHGSSPLPFAVTELRGYAGCRWIRHTFLLQDAGLIVIDSLISETTESLPKDFSLEWNILGDVAPNARGAEVEQSGVTTIFQHFGTAQAKWEDNASASWHRVMENREYPHTSSPLKKCVLSPAIKRASGAQEYSFVSGFWLEHEVQSVHWDSVSCHLKIQWPQSPPDAGREYSGCWGNINCGDNFLQIEICRTPDAKS